MCVKITKDVEYAKNIQNVYSAKCYKHFMYSMMDDTYI